MKREANGPALSAIFVDYDNIYLSLKRKNEDAARRFSKDAGLWLRELEAGALITSTSGYGTVGPRRIVLNRCYGNPVPRRNSHDNSTDMNSFPFIRHHFLRAGAEVVDCPPLTAQLKNSADIRIVMDVRDMITHDTYFDEFIILSSDADFTPLLHRLRAHARRTVIYANDQTASPYTAISDGEVRESDLLRLLLDARGTDRAITSDAAPAQLPQPGSQNSADLSIQRRELVGEVANLVRAAGQPVPLEALADRLVRQFGHERTSGSNWAGMGGFRDLLANYLPDGFKISDQAPFVVFELASPDEIARAEPQMAPPRAAPAIAPPATEPAAPATAYTPPARSAQPLPATNPAPGRAPFRPASEEEQRLAASAGVRPSAIGQPAGQAALRTQSNPLDQLPQHPLAKQAPPAAAAPQAQPPHAAQPAPSPAPRAPSSAVAVQQMVARIYDACQAPPLSPPEYRVVFDIMAQELAARGLNGTPTLDAIASLAKGHGVEMRRDDVRFILDVVSEADPWFEQGVSANLFASRFRNFVVARCRSQGMALSAEEIDLIDHWFAGGGAALDARPSQPQRPAPQQQLPAPTGPQPQPQSTSDAWWSTDAASGQRATGTDGGDDFPRIIRSRIRG